MYIRPSYPVDKRVDRPVCICVDTLVYKLLPLGIWLVLLLTPNRFDPLIPWGSAVQLLPRRPFLRIVRNPVRNPELGNVRIYHLLCISKYFLMRHFRFDTRYGLLTLALMAIETFIGFCMHDAVIRPYGGDVLVVILLYCLVRTFWDLPVMPLALGVLTFSYIEETLQYFHLADRLGFTKPSLARTLIGTYFTWIDILSYTLGISAVLAIETLAYRRRSIKQ